MWVLLAILVFGVSWASYWSGYRSGVADSEPTQLSNNRKARF